MDEMNALEIRLARLLYKASRECQKLGAEAILLVYRTKAKYAAVTNPALSEAEQRIFAEKTAPGIAEAAAELEKFN